MTDREPVEATNLDRYGSQALPWSRPHDLLVASPAQPGTSYFLGTSRPDGRPHSASVGAVWLDGDLSFTSGPGTRKARNLVANPACTFSVGHRLPPVRPTPSAAADDCTRFRDRPHRSCPAAPAAHMLTQCTRTTRLASPDRASPIAQAGAHRCHAEPTSFAGRATRVHIGRSRAVPSGQPRSLATCR